MFRYLTTDSGHHKLDKKGNVFLCSIQSLEQSEPEFLNTLRGPSMTIDQVDQVVCSAFAKDYAAHAQCTSKWQSIRLIIRFCLNDHKPLIRVPKASHTTFLGGAIFKFFGLLSACRAYAK
jgi:hypothetical protein